MTGVMVMIMTTILFVLPGSWTAVQCGRQCAAGREIKDNRPIMARWYIIHAYSGFEGKVRDADHGGGDALGSINLSNRSKYRPKR